MGLSPDFVDDPIFEVISRLSDCLCSELEAAGGPGLCYCGLAIGAAPPPFGMADCSNGDCGVAWVRLVSGFPSTSFPLPNQVASTSCASPLAYQVELGVARCAPVATGRELFPDKQATFDAARLYMGDMRAMKRALLCCLPAEQKQAGGPAIVVQAGTWTPLDNAGGRSGGLWSGFVGWA
jgi:hypothetical protein